MAVENIEPDFGGTTEVPNTDEIEPNEFEQLQAKVAEFLEESALAFERMARNQAEIERLKAETRAMLKSLCAA